MSWRLAGLLVGSMLFWSPPAAGLLEVESVDRDRTPPPVLAAIDEARDIVADRAQASPEARSEAYGRLGDVLFAHGFAIQAEQAYRNARDLNPPVSDWHYLLGMLAMDKGQPDEAAEYFSQAIERNPFDAVAHVRRGQAWLDLGQPDKAGRDFERALALQPDAPAALAGQARVLLARGEHAAAAERLERVLEVSPEATRLHQPLAMAYRGLGQLERAREHLALIGSGDAPINDRLLTRVLAQSRSPQFYLESALARADVGELDEARRLLALGAQLAPEDTAILENYGEVVARQGDLDEAAAAFGRWIRLDPESARAQFLLGQVRELQGDPGAAAEAYQRALALEPQRVDAAEALAFLALETGEFAEAERRFDRLLGDIEQASTARFGFWAAIAMLLGGDCVRGEAALERLRARFPADGDVLGALARVRATCAAAGPELLDEALKWAEAVYQTAPTADNSATLAMVFAALGRFDDAIDLQAQAIFEALKLGQLEVRPELQADMERYQNAQPARRPFTRGFTGLPTSGD